LEDLQGAEGKLTKSKIVRQSWPSIEVGHVARDQCFVDSKKRKSEVEVGVVGLMKSEFTKVITVH
jgi:hypothetical protein